MSGPRDYQVQQIAAERYAAKGLPVQQVTPWLPPQPERVTALGAWALVAVNVVFWGLFAWLCVVFGPMVVFAVLFGVALAGALCRVAFRGAR